MCIFSVIWSKLKQTLMAYPQVCPSVRNHLRLLQRQSEALRPETPLLCVPLSMLSLIKQALHSQRQTPASSFPGDTWRHCGRLATSLTGHLLDSPRPSPLGLRAVRLVPGDPYSLVYSHAPLRDGARSEIRTPRPCANITQASLPWLAQLPPAAGLSGLAQHREGMQPRHRRREMEEAASCGARCC